MRSCFRHITSSRSTMFSSLPRPAYTLTGIRPGRSFGSSTNRAKTFCEGMKFFSQPVAEIGAIVGACKAADQKKSLIEGAVIGGCAGVICTAGVFSGILYPIQTIALAGVIAGGLIKSEEKTPTKKI